MKRFRRFVILGVMALTVIIVAVAIWIYQRLNEDAVTLGQTDGELAFMSDRNGNWDIAILDPDGTLHNVTEKSEGQDFFFNFTFSGSVINFISNRSDGWTLASVNADGTELRTFGVAEAILLILTEGNTDWDPAWNPGGEKIVWAKVAGLPPSVDLYLSNSNGSDSKQLTDDSAYETAPSWSPDGIHIAYISDEGGSQNVYVMNVESGEITQLTDTKFYDYQPVWSMAGDRILFISEQNESMSTGALEFFLINPDGSDLQKLGDEVFKGDLTYAPYGGQVAFMSNETGNWHIYVMDSDGSNVERLTNGDSNNLFPAWRPVPYDDHDKSATGEE